MNKFHDEVKNVPVWDNVRKIVIVGERVVPEKVIEGIEDVFRLPVKTGVCLVRPFEKLPQERIGYVGSLGMLDHLRNERKRYKLSSNFIKRSFNKTLNFLDRYF